MIGQLVTSRAGHDKGGLYVVVAEEGDFVFLCDGRLKPPDKPKKKRRKHIQQINQRVEGELLQKLQKGEKVYAEEILYALKKYTMTQTGCDND
ncbi:MAG: hypothetical protein HFH82_02375 [Lachnospiraceae bacterium]|nr:hypothetical protein [Lachnospiraceae bacterium]